MKFNSLLAATAIAALLGSAASAATVTDDVTFSASGFSATGGTPPKDPVTGEFVITFDPTQTYTNDTADIHLKSLNISLGSTLAFSYIPASAAPASGADELVVGGLAGAVGSASGACCVQFSPATDDFWLFINDFTTTPTFNQVGYAQVAAGNNLFYTDSSAGGAGSVTVTVPTSAAPEPASWAIMLLGFGGVGAAMRARRGRRAVATA